MAFGKILSSHSSCSWVFLGDLFSNETQSLSLIGPSALLPRFWGGRKPLEPPQPTPEGGQWCHKNVVAPPTQTMQNAWQETREGNNASEPQKPRNEKMEQIQNWSYPSRMVTTNKTSCNILIATLLSHEQRSRHTSNLNPERQAAAQKKKGKPAKRATTNCDLCAKLNLIYTWVWRERRTQRKKTEPHEETLFRQSLSLKGQHVTYIGLS